jgi:hypothetical protein
MVRRSDPPPCLYSPECVEVEFSEVHSVPPDVRSTPNDRRLNARVARPGARSSAGRGRGSGKSTDDVIMPRMAWRMLVLAALVFANQRSGGSS